MSRLSVTPGITVPIVLLLLLMGIPSTVRDAFVPAIWWNATGGGVVGTVNTSPGTKSVLPAEMVNPILLELNGVPTVAVPNAPETDPVTLKWVASVAVTVIVSAALVVPPVRFEIVPSPVPV